MTSWKSRRAITRTALVLVVIAVVVVAGVGYYFYTQYARVPPTQPTLRVGLSLPLTNPVGIHAKQAAEMAVEEINNAGGVTMNGTQYKITLVSEDSNEMDPLIPVDQGVTAFKRLIEQDGAQVVLGGVRTDIVVAQSQLLKQYNLVMIDVETNQPIVERLVLNNYADYKFYFHTFAGGVNSSAGPFLLTFPQTLKSFCTGKAACPDVTKVALIAENALWTAGLAGRPAGNSTFFVGLQRAGFQLVYSDLYATTQSDFSAFLTKVKDSGAGLVIFLFSGPPGIAFTRQWQAFSWSPGKKPIVFGPGLLGGFSWFWDQTAGAADGTIWWPATVKVAVTSKTLPFIDKFQARFKETPNTAAFDMYDSVYILKTGLERANTWRPDKLVPALEQVEYEGTIGVIKFTKSHGLDFSRPNLYWYFGQWQKGQLVPVWNWGARDRVSDLIL